MKQVIAKRNKKTYFYLLLLTLLTLMTSIRYINVSFMKFLAIPTIAITSLASIVWLFYLVDPRGVIEKHGDTIVILKGFAKIKVDLCDILDVCCVEKQNNPQEYQKNTIKIKAMINQKQVDILCGDVLDVQDCLQTLLSLIKK